MNFFYHIKQAAMSEAQTQKAADKWFSDNSEPKKPSIKVADLKIKIDGVMRSVIDNKNRLIGDDVESIQRFWRWFGDSKNVDDIGRPIVVYHGGTFNPATDDLPRTRSPGMFFTEIKFMAKSYASYVGRRSETHVVEAYLKCDNPFDKENWQHLSAPWIKEWIEFWRVNEKWTDRNTGEEMSDSDVIDMIHHGLLYDYDGVGSRERWNDFLATVSLHHDGYFGQDPTEARFGEVPTVHVVFKPESIWLAAPYSRPASEKEPVCNIEKELTFPPNSP